MGMAKCKDCKYYGVCILNRRSADADVTGCKIYEVGERDFVEVVRCKDCKYRSQYNDENGFYKCGGIQTEDGELVLMVKPDQFCSYGERREGNECRIRM